MIINFKNNGWTEKNRKNLFSISLRKLHKILENTQNKKYFSQSKKQKGEGKKKKEKRKTEFKL